MVDFGEHESHSYFVKNKLRVAGKGFKNEKTVFLPKHFQIVKTEALR
jgi:hypothetical protein